MHDIVFKAATLWFGLASVALAQSAPQATAARHVGNRIVLFETSEPHLYYLVPERWQKRAVYLERTDDPEHPLSLTVLMGPSYEWSDELQSSIRDRDAFAVFLPVPKRYTATTLRFPESLAETLSSLQPSDQMSTGDLIYLRAKLSDAGLDALRMVAAAETLVTGLLTYDFPYQDGIFPIVSEVWLNLTPADLSVGAGTPNTVLGWYRDARSDGEVVGAASMSSPRNGLCDPHEHCVFVDEATNLFWSKQRTTPHMLGMSEWISFCARLDYGGYDDWHLPEKSDVLLAASNGLWSRLRGFGALFYRDVWWDTRTTTADVDPSNAWSVDIDRPRAYSASAQGTLSDRGLCVRDSLDSRQVMNPKSQAVMSSKHDVNKETRRDQARKSDSRIQASPVQRF